MKVYLAAPLFSLAERAFNEQLANSLETHRPGLHVILPQREAEKLAGAEDFPQQMCARALKTIASCDAVVAVLEGADADSGTCVEIGYAAGCRKPIIGVRTDFRASEDRGLNLMVANVCAELIIASSLESTPEQLAAQIVAYLPPPHHHTRRPNT